MKDTREVPEKLWKTILKRCDNFMNVSLLLRNLDQDTLETLMVSCYTQGMEDAVSIMKSQNLDRET